MIGRLSQALRFTPPEVLNEVNTTNQKHAIGVRLTVATAVVCAVAFIVAAVAGNNDLAETVLFYWLTFLAAYVGLGVIQFGVKRNTDKDTKVAVAQAQAQSQPPTVKVEGNVGTVDASGTSPTTAERAAMYPPAVRPQPTGDARVDDERGDP